MEKTLQILSNATGTNQELLNIKVSPGIGDIVVQLDVFDQQNVLNKVQRQDSTTSLNLNSHLDVFQAVLRQVDNTSQKLQFLNILQHLVQIDPKEPVSEIIWNTAEKLVHRAVQLENNEEAECLLRSAITHKLSCQNCCSESNTLTIRKENETITTPQPPQPSLPPPCMPGPPPPPIPGPPPPPMPGPPPPPPPAQPDIPGAPPPPLIPGAPAPPLPPLLIPGVPTAPGAIQSVSHSSLPQQNTPKASIKMKTLNWTKIPQHKIMGKQNLWTIMANNRQYNCLEIIDFKGIEGLFCLQAPKSNNADAVDGKKKRESKHINLLNAQRSLKINIFLSQFKGNNSTEDIIQLIRNGQHKVLGPEKLKDLLQYLPDKEEIEVLLAYDGDFQRLANAEKFLLLLLAVPNYRLRIESMLLKEEFAINITYLEPCMESIFKAGDDLMKNEALQEVLRLIIIIGNFLNSGGYAGNAAGIKLSSLNKLTEIRANKTGMNLLHLIASEVERYNPDLLNFTNELSFLENISKINIEQIPKDIRDLDLPLQQLKAQIELPNTDEDIKQQMGEFLKSAESQMGHLKNGLNELESLRLVLADFFCEDPPTFKLDECFKIFQTFCEQFKEAVKENERRKHSEKLASLRQKQKEVEELARKAKYAGSSAESSPVLSLKRRRITSNHSDDVNNCFISTETSCANGEELPNSRPHSLENQDELLEYLRSSARDMFDKPCRGRPRSRKNSLDKCPDLLKFNIRDDRERMSSTILSPPNEENSVVKKPDEIKQDVVSATSKRPLSLLQRRLSNGNERTLQTLPEDKCLTISTHEPTPRGESLQIVIRSNSTLDNDTGKSKHSSSVVEVIRTPLPQSKPVFNFDTIKPFENENKSFEPISQRCEVTKEPITPRMRLDIKRSQSFTAELETKENCKERSDQFKGNSIQRNAMRLKIPTDDNKNELLKDPLSAPEVELRRPNVSFKALANVIKLGHRISSINEQELKRVKSNLRTPTIEGREFSFSPPRNSLATPTRTNAYNWNVQTPKIGGAQFTFSPIRELPPISSLALPNKSNDSKNPQILNEKLNDIILNEEQKQGCESSKTLSLNKNNKVSDKSLSESPSEQNLYDKCLQEEKQLVSSLGKPCCDEETIPINSSNVDNNVDWDPIIDKTAQEIKLPQNHNSVASFTKPVLRASNENIFQEKSKPMNSSPKVQTNNGNSLLKTTTSIPNSASTCQLIKNEVSDTNLEDHIIDTLNNTSQESNNQRTNFVNGNQTLDCPLVETLNEISHLEAQREIKANSRCNKDTSKHNPKLSNTSTANVKESPHQETPNQDTTTLHFSSNKEVQELLQKPPSKKTFSSRFANKLKIPMNKIRSLSPKRSQHSENLNETITAVCSNNNLSKEPEKKSKILQFAQKLHLTKTSSAQATIPASKSILEATEKVSNKTLSSAGTLIQPMEKIQKEDIKLPPPTRTTSFKLEPAKSIRNSQSTKKFTPFNGNATQKSNITHKNNFISTSSTINSDISDLKANHISSNSITNIGQKNVSKNNIRRSSLTSNQPKSNTNFQSIQKLCKTTNTKCRNGEISNESVIPSNIKRPGTSASSKVKTKFNTELRRGSTNSVTSMDRKIYFQNSTQSIKESNLRRSSICTSSINCATYTNPTQRKPSIRNSISSVSSITSANLVTRRGSSNTPSRNADITNTCNNITKRKPSIRNSISSISSKTSLNSLPRIDSINPRNALSTSQTPSDKGSASFSIPATKNTALRRYSIPSSKSNTMSANSIQSKPSIRISSKNSTTSANSVKCRGNINTSSKNNGSNIPCASITQRYPNIRNSISSVTNITSSNSLPRRDSITKTSKNSSANNTNLKPGISSYATNNSNRNIKISGKISTKSQLKHANVKIKATLVNPNSVQTN